MLKIFSLIVTILSIESALAQGVSLEKFTGAWCGWCPYGAWVIDSTEARLPEKAVVIDWHFGDALEHKVHDSLAAQISNGSHPAVSHGRRPVTTLAPLYFSDTHPWFTLAQDDIAMEPSSAIQVITTIDRATRTVNAHAALTPQATGGWPSNARLYSVAVITEDDIPLTQKLYAENGGSLPDLVDYPHQNVARQVAGSVLGDTMMFAWGSGRWMQSYQFAVDEKIDLTKAELKILIIMEAPEQVRRVINAYKSGYLVESKAKVGGDPKGERIRVYPNPSKRTVRIENIEGAFERVRLVDLIGRAIHPTCIAGEGWLEVGVAEIPSGVYTAAVQTTAGTQQVRVVIER